MNCVADAYYKGIREVGKFHIEMSCSCILETAGVQQVDYSNDSEKYEKAAPLK